MFNRNNICNYFYCQSTLWRSKQCNLVSFMTRCNGTKWNVEMALSWELSTIITSEFVHKFNMHMFKLKDFRALFLLKGLRLCLSDEQFHNLINLKWTFFFHQINGDQFYWWPTNEYTHLRTFPFSISQVRRIVTYPLSCMKSVDLTCYYLKSNSTKLTLIK